VFPDLVRLVWVAPDASAFALFADTLLRVAGDNLDGRFSFKLHASRATRPGLAALASPPAASPPAASAAGRGASGQHFGRKAPPPPEGRALWTALGGGGGASGSAGGGGGAVGFDCGRPSLEVELRRVEQFGGGALVVCCGPPPLVRACRALAAASKVPFRAESFEL
jgi:hypothetical protein